jgi:hypothetical protein
MVRSGNRTVNLEAYSFNRSPGDDPINDLATIEQ